jgi:Cu+-exporting ATPase
MPNIPFFSHHPDVEIDPVCKMEVSVEDPPGGKHRHEGTTYYFCGVGCRNVFAENPAKYLDPNFEGEPM